MTTSPGTQFWNGVGFMDIIGGDTVYLEAFYPNRDLQTVLLVATVASGRGAHAVVTTDGFLTSYLDSVITASAGLLSTGNTCSQQTGLAAASEFNAVVPSGSACVLAKWHTSFAVSFKAVAAVNPLSASNVTINGPFFQPTGPSRVVTIPSRGAAAVQHLMARLHRAR